MSALHFSTNTRVQIDREDVTVHHRQDRWSVEQRDGRPVLSADRTVVDVATQVGERRLLQVGDWLVQNCEVRPAELVELARLSHLDGVQRARRVAPYVRLSTTGGTTSGIAPSVSVTTRDARRSRPPGGASS